MKKIIVFIILLFLAGLSIIWLSLTTGTVRIIDDFNYATENLKNKRNYNENIFKIYNLKFFDSLLISDYLNKSLTNTNNQNLCLNENKTEIIIIDIITYNYNLPFECKFFINNNLKLTKVINKVECGNYCQDKESIFSFDFGNYSIFKDHEINICCNNHCNKKILEKIC
ncbi:MAG: hypothetical protein ACOC3X_00235 [Nanoarchaeota archaeon]